MRVDRRAVLTGAAACAVWPVGAATPFGPGAEWGWSAIHLGTGRRIGEGGGRRLPMCSSFKWLLAACVLARVDGGRERLDRPIAYTRADLVPYAPVVEASLAAAGGVRATLGVGALCAAALRTSDNAAANLLLRTIGGPVALTAWLRRHGDPVTRLDRIEPELNMVPRGDVRDTTTSDAMVKDLCTMLYGEVLSPASRVQLLTWMLACEPGASRLPAGVPLGWRVAHRTGTRTLDPGHAPAERAAYGDVGILIPPHGAPIAIAAYVAGTDWPMAAVEAWFGGLAREVAAER